MSNTPFTTASASSSGVSLPRPKGRLMIDAPVRAFHWLFALSFVGAWLTAESEHWRAVHVTLGYAFGGLLLFRLMYGLIGPKQARLSSLWRRVSGLAGWCRGALSGKLDLPRLATLAAGGAMLLMLSVAAPLVLSGYASHIEWLGLEDAMEEVHEFFANALMAFVVAHLALMVVLSVQRRKNLAQTMLTGRTDGVGPDLAKANRGWLAMIVVLAVVGFVAWDVTQAPADGSLSSHTANGSSLDDDHHDDD